MVVTELSGDTRYVSRPWGHDQKQEEEDANHQWHTGGGHAERHGGR